MPLQLIGYLTVSAFAISPPVILIVFVGRKWITRNVGRAMIAISFATSTAYALSHLERFDVWRHGMPSLADLLFPYGAYVSVFGIVGWLVGGLIARRNAGSV